MNTFLELKNRYVLKCTVAAETALHVGTGVAGTTTDAPFFREGGRPLIPGSSLRGAMRSAVERIVLTIASRAEVEVHSTFDESLDELGPNECMAKNIGARKKFEQLSATEQTKQVHNGELRLCMLCQFFGSTLMAARFRVTDALLAQNEPFELVRRDGVGIDRDTETAKAKIKFDFEVLEHGPKFNFSMHLENASSEDFALLYILLKEMDEGLDVGGKRSRGLGRLTKPSLEVKYFDEDFIEQPHSLIDFLTAGLRTMDVAMLSEFLKLLHFDEVFNKGK